MLRELNENEMMMVSGGADDEPEDEVVVTGVRRKKFDMDTWLVNNMMKSGLGDFLPVNNFGGAFGLPSTGVTLEPQPDIDIPEIPDAPDDPIAEEDIVSTSDALANALACGLSAGNVDAWCNNMTPGEPRR